MKKTGEAISGLSAFPACRASRGRRGGRLVAAMLMMAISGVANATANRFNAIDEAYGNPPVAVQDYLNGHIYTKLVGVPFTLDVAALNNNQVQTDYAIAGTESVSLKLVDNTDGACVLDNTQSNYCNSTCTGKTAVTGGSHTLTFTSGDAGQKQSASFTLNSAYLNVAAIISDGANTACSTDAFSVRPTSIASVTSSNATNASTSGTPIFKAGSDQFALTATITGVAGNASGYTGILKINSVDNAAIQPVSPATAGGTLAPAQFSAATSGTPSSTATGATFTYSEAGAFQLLGYDPATDFTTPRGVFDDTWTAVDSVSTKNDCVINSYSNTKDSFGKYGCNFGIVVTTAPFGRFTPHHFVAFAGAVATRATAGCTAPSSSFTYMGEPFGVTFTLTAKNSADVTTRNYAGALAKLDGATASKWTAYAAPDSIGMWAIATNINASPACKAIFASSTPFATTLTCPASSVAASAPRIVMNGTSTGAWAQFDSPMAGSATFNGNVIFNRANAVDGSYESLQVGIAPRDIDGVQLLPTALDLDADNSGSGERASIATTAVRYGRMRISNAYGSELLPLPVPMKTEYFKSGTGWIVNADDNCTTLTAGNVTLSNPTRNMTAIATTPSFSSPLLKGDAKLTLSAPGTGRNGSVDIQAAVPAWLKYNWNTTTAGDENPAGRAIFGIYKSPIIYLRENY